MFGMLKRRRQLKNIADTIGVDVHRQVLMAMKINDNAINDQKKTFFIAGYLDNFIHYGFRSFETNYSTKSKFIKHICNGVIPNGQLWKRYQHAQAALELTSNCNDRKEYSDALDQYEKGLIAGESNAISLFKKKQSSDELLNYLSKRQ
jgi:hypothetical protein